MGKIVVALGNANIRERTIAAIMGEQQSGHARGIRLECECQNVKHQIHVLGMIGRALRQKESASWILWVAQFFRLMEPEFQFAHACQVLIQFGFVIRVQPALHLSRVILQNDESKTDFLSCRRCRKALRALSGRALFRNNLF